MDVAIVGAGRVGTSLGVLLARAGHSIVAAAGRGLSSRERLELHLPGVPLLSGSEAASKAEVVLLSVPDDRIAEVCEAIAKQGGFREGTWVVHHSGSNGLGDLEAAEEAGAQAMSVHPLQTAPDVEAGLSRFPGSGFAVTARGEQGFALGERLVRDVGGEPFRLLDEHKPLYHAAAVFCSNYLTVVEGVAERLFTAAGIPEPRKLFGPLAEATLGNLLERGASASLTGPVARGDAGTVWKNLDALSKEDPEAVPLYIALARAALRIAPRMGPRDRAGVEEVLDGWM